MTDEQFQLLVNYDYTEIEKIPGQISSIDETTKAILQELQKETPLESSEPTEFEMKILEVLETQTVEPLENPADTPKENIVVPVEEVPVEEVPEEVVEEEPVEEVSVDEVEEVTEEEAVEEIPVEEEVPVEDSVDYLQLLYQEVKTQNELDQQNHVAIVEHLESLEAHGAYTNEVDAMTGMYLMWVVPFLLIVLLFSKFINPFLRG